MTSGGHDGIRAVMNGSDRRTRAAVLRAGLGFIEPAYAWVAYARNRLYDAGHLRIVTLPRATISIGNLTAGGTGKTPMVRWLASRLRDEGRHVSVLSRGYKSKHGELGDEQCMLDRLLNAPGLSRVTIVASPDRLAASRRALNEQPETDTFLLDDGFQHRRVARAMDIVLLSAVDPFGLGHILPRGLLRESVAGIRRASAVVITHADQVNEQALAAIEQVIRRHSAHMPIYRAVHAHSGIRSAGRSASEPPDRTLDDLKARRFFAFAGIGNPDVLHQQLQQFRQAYAGGQWFADHHSYTAGDLARLRDEARRHNADVLLTTEKDWAKVAELDGLEAMEIWRLDVELRFLNEGDLALLEQARRTLRDASAS